MGDSGKYFKDMRESDLIRKAIVDNFNSSRRKLHVEQHDRDAVGYDKRASSALCCNDSWTPKLSRTTKPCLRCHHGSKLNGSPLWSKHSFSSPHESRAAVYSAGCLANGSCHFPKCPSFGKTMNRSNCNVGSFMLMDNIPSEATSSTSLAELVGSLCHKPGTGFSADHPKQPDCPFGSCSILRGSNKDRRDTSQSILKMHSSTPQCTGGYRPLSCSFDLDDDNGDDQKLKSTLSAGSTRPYAHAYDGGHHGKPVSNGFHAKMNGGSTLLEECCDLLCKIGDVTSATATATDKDAENHGGKFFPGYRKLIGDGGCMKTKNSDKSPAHHCGAKSHEKGNGNSNGKSSSPPGCHGHGKKSGEQSKGHHHGTCWDKKHSQNGGCCCEDNCCKKLTHKDSVTSCASLGMDSACALASDSGSGGGCASSVEGGIDAYRSLCLFDDDDDTMGDDFDESDSSCARPKGDHDCFGGIRSSSSMEKKDCFDSGDCAIKPLKCPKKLDSSSDCCFVDEITCDDDEEDEDDECILICPGAEDWFPVAPELQHAVARLAMKSLQAGDNVKQDLSRLKDANILPQDFCIPGEDGSNDHSSRSCESCAMCTLSSKESLAATPSQLKLAAEKLVEHIICRASKVEAAKGGTPDLSECDKYLDELAKKLSIMIQKMSDSSLANGSSTSGGSSDAGGSSDDDDDASDGGSTSATSNSSSGNEKKKRKKKHKNASSNNSALVAKRHLPTTVVEGRLVLECLAAQLQANMAAVAGGTTKGVAEQCRRGSPWTEIGGRPPVSPPWRRGNANNSQGDRGTPKDGVRSTEKTGKKDDSAKNKPIGHGHVHAADDQGNKTDGNEDEDSDSDTTISRQDDDDDDLPPTMILELPEDEEQPQQQQPKQRPNQLPQQQQPKQQPQQQQRQPKQQQQQQPKQRQPKQQQQQQPSPSSETTPRRGSIDREVLAELERHLEHSASLSDDPSLKTFITDVVYGLYSIVRGKLERMLEQQQEAAESRAGHAASPSPSKPPTVVDNQLLLKNADREIRDAVLPVVVEHIAWIVRQDARQSVRPGDREAIVRALAAEFVDTIVTNAVLKTDPRGRSRRPYTKVFVVESNDDRVSKKKKWHSPDTVAAAAAKKRKKNGVPEKCGCRH